MRSKSLFAAFGVSTLLCAQSVLAHPGHGAPSGFITGVLHPLTGWDHILAMIAVGLVAAQLRGRALWLLPATFLACMAGGGLLGTFGAHVPMVEQGIAASILVLGLFLATGVKPAMPAIAFLVGFFAIFHGYAHGTEMHAGLSPMTYAAGFIVATALLHGIGIGAGLTLKQSTCTRLSRLTGSVVAACGLLLLAV